MYQSTGSLITQKAVERAGVNLPILQPSALGVTLKLLLDIASICNVDNVNRHVAWTFLWRITIHVKLFERHTTQDSLEKQQLKFNVNILEQLYNMRCCLKWLNSKLNAIFFFKTLFSLSEKIRGLLRSCKPSSLNATFLIYKSTISIQFKIRNDGSIKKLVT